MVQASKAEAVSNPREHSFKRASLILLIVTIIAISVATTLSLIYWLKPQFLSSVSEYNEENSASDERPVVYTPLVSPLLLTYLEGGRTHYVKIQFSLVSHHPDTSKLVDLHKDRLRHEWLMALQQVPFKGLLTKAGKTALQSQALAVAQAVFEEEGAPMAIDQVLFTQFIIQ